MPHLVGVCLNLFKEVSLLEVLFNLLAHGETVHTDVETGSLADSAVVVEDVDALQVVLFAKHIVVDIVSRSHLQATCTELNVHIVVLNHRNLTTDQRHNHALALEVRILRVVRIDTHRSVTHNGFRAGRSNNGITVFADNLVAEIVKFAVLFLIYNLLVAEGSLRSRVPVDHSHTTVNQALLVEVDKHVEHTLRAHLVHSERRAAPVARSTEFLQLLKDDAAVLLFPFPSVLEKLITGEVGLLDAFGGQSCHHLSFRCNRGVVSARHPQGILALHTRAAHKDILNSVVEHVSHVEHTGYIGRRNNNRVRLAAVGSRFKQVMFQPILIPFPFYFLGTVL